MKYNLKTILVSVFSVMIAFTIISCADHSDDNTSIFARESHVAVWTGKEMILWGGRITGGGHPYTNEDREIIGVRYNPSTNTWTKMSNVLAPEYDENDPILGTFEEGNIGVCTGEEIIVLGTIFSYSGYSQFGGRYNPTVDTWRPISLINAPSIPDSFFGGSFSFWTGIEVLVWCNSFGSYGAIYNPSADTWTDISKTNAPSYNFSTAVWTGTEMIVWSNSIFGSDFSILGARYDHFTDTWTEISTNNATSAHENYTAIWTGTEMIVWGGYITFEGPTNKGAKYNPATDTWSEISLINAPSARYHHTATWTGTEMIVWGGISSEERTNTGARYNPLTDTWTEISTNNAPSARRDYTAIWTGTEMIIWGGYCFEKGYTTNIGSRYNPIDDTWTRIAAIL